MGEKVVVVWTKSAKRQLLAVLNHIGQDSVKNALKVTEDIIVTVDRVVDNPEMYPRDKYKLNNDGSYRALEKHKYRIAYQYTKNAILVLSVDHTSKAPRFY